MRYILILGTWGDGGCSFVTEVFYDQAQAKAAQAAFIDAMKRLNKNYATNVYPDHLFSVASLYIELLKNDPITDPEVLLQRAQKSYDLLYKKDT